MVTQKSPSTKSVVPPPTEVVPVPTAHIDNGFIWQQLNDINRGLGRIESSITDLSGRIDKAEIKLTAVSEKLNKMLWVSGGWIAAIIFLATLAGLILKAFDKI